MPFTSCKKKWAVRNRTRTADASVSRTARDMDSGREESLVLLLRDREAGLFAEIFF